MSWAGVLPQARLHLATVVGKDEVAKAAGEGIETIVAGFKFGERKNVDFDRNGYREFAKECRRGGSTAALAAALTTEHPEKRAGGLQAAPLVMMFGQGHQNFLERLVDIPAGVLPNRLRKLRSPPDLRDSAKIAEALFEPWKRADETDAFRWDLKEDQRYALRYGDPSTAGAAPTVHGANRLAAIGFLSFATVPGERRMSALGARRGKRGGWEFLWPIWSEPLSRTAVETLLAHPDLAKDDWRALSKLGVIEVYRARRIANGKFMNVTRAVPRNIEGASAPP
ncbi:MAG: hypothetical protein IT537_22240 [Hyphomicrobiales bacterium]|nr:hypothetical protein [Hyphomicrobiales bacterium]